MLLKIQNLSKIIKGIPVLEEINLEFESGKIYGLRGKNGSGKTMLIRAISGLILPTTGEITMDGLTLGKDMSFPKSLGMLIESPSFLPDYSGFENLRLIASIKQLVTEEQIKETIRSVGLDPEDKRKYKKYSLGMKQRLGIGAAIMESPELLILDEPTNALDEKGIEMVRVVVNDLKEKGSLVILACHDKEELDYLADEIYTMAEGHISGIEKKA